MKVRKVVLPAKLMKFAKLPHFKGGGVLKCHAKLPKQLS